MRIFFSVGEPSGDVHGANLIRALQSLRGSVECVGFGGDRMAKAGSSATPTGYHVHADGSLHKNEDEGKQ